MTANIMQANGTMTGSITVSGSNGFVADVNGQAVQPGVAIGAIGSYPWNQQLNPGLTTAYGTITSVSAGNSLGLQLGDTAALEAGNSSSPVNANFFGLSVQPAGASEIGAIFQTGGTITSLTTTLAPQPPPSGNLIVNGDFEQGNTGFTTQYTYSPQGIGGAQTYAIVNDPHTVHPSAASYGDHTTGKGLMMAVNGATTPNVLVWGETVAVTPNATYEFSGWISSWTPSAPGQLNVLFNGSSVGIMNAPSTTAVWVEFSANWNSGSATSVAIELRNLSTADIGNDFALDDISLTGPSAPPTQTMVSSSMSPSTYGQPVTFTATVASGGSPVSAGTVTFQEGTTVLAAAVPVDSNGHATFTTSTVSAAASPHTITAYYSGSASFEASSSSVTQTVNKAALVVIAANVFRPYGTANPTLSGTVVGIQNNDPITATYSSAATPASPVGSYTITPTLADGGSRTLSNYVPTIVNGTLTIMPAPLIVTPENVTREFETSNPPLTGTVIGIQNGDNITASYSTTATLTSPVGIYPITATLQDQDNKLSNYSVTLNQGTLTVLADPLLVTSTADSGPGSLRSVLLSAPADSTVHFWSGVRGTITLTSGMLSLTQDVSIVGLGASLLTISGNKMFRVFQIASAATVTLSGLTIANGNSTGSVGGGIYNDGTLTVTSSTISGNFASPRGGGIYNSPSGTLTLDHSLISGNSTANAGGGVFNEGTLTVSASTLTGNGSANADGGAIFNLGTLIVSNSTLSGNGGSGAYGGAIRNDRVLTVEQSTFSGNSANLGGAVYNVGTLVINHSTLSGNKAAVDGGGIQNTGHAVLVARDTIFAGNTTRTGTGPDISGVLTSLGHNLIGNRRGGRGFVASDLLNVNPLLGPLQNNGGPTQTMALLPGSPAVDAGDNTSAPAYDQRGPGYPRIVGGQIDIGAYEVQEGEGTSAAALPRGYPQMILLGPRTAPEQDFVAISGSIDNPARNLTPRPAVAAVDRFFASLNKNKQDREVVLSQRRQQAAPVGCWVPDLQGAQQNLSTLDEPAN
jgi:hypothetical protein